MRTVVVTGVKGVIGNLISDGLAGWEIRGVDLPECDVRDHDQVLAALRGADAVVHLAWDTTENFLSATVQPDNHVMAHNAYAAARAAGVGRVVAASSVHADRFWPRRKALRREVVCIRFGGVNSTDTIPQTEPERGVWLSHRDCRTLIARTLSAPLPPGGYVALYGISANAGCLHDLSNALGWHPQRGAPRKREKFGPGGRRSRTEAIADQPKSWCPDQLRGLSATDAALPHRPSSG